MNEESEKVVAWKLRKFPNHKDARGELGVIELHRDICFEVKRFFFLRKISNGMVRGGHFHKDLQQVIVCLSGSFAIKLDDGKTKKTLKIQSKNNDILYLQGTVWRELFDFSPDALVLVACDRIYSEDHVIRNYDDFLRLVE